MEAEKRVRKRRMRLLLAVEDAFAHANRMAKDAAAGVLNRSSVAGGGGADIPLFHNGKQLPSRLQRPNIYPLFSWAFRALLVSLSISSSNLGSRTPTNQNVFVTRDGGLEVFTSWHSLLLLRRLTFIMFRMMPCQGTSCHHHLSQDRRLVASVTGGY